MIPNQGMLLVIIKEPILTLRWIAVIRLLYRIWQSWILSTRHYLMQATRRRHWIPCLMHSGNCILIYSLKRRKLSQKGEWRFAKQKLTHVDGYRTSSIYHTMFYKIFYLLLSTNYEPILSTILQEHDLITRMIQSYSKDKASGKWMTSLNM